MSRLDAIEKQRRERVADCRVDMIAAWLRKEDKVMKKGGPTWKQLIQALRVIKEIHLSEKIFEKLMKQRKVSNPLKSVKEKSRRDLSTDEKRPVKKRKKEMKRRKSSHTDSDNEEKGETHRYKKRKIE